jgi:protein subunit release factor A
MYDQDRVTDHRTSTSVSGVARVLAGDMLEVIVNALVEADTKERTEGFLKNLVGNQ